MGLAEDVGALIARVVVAENRAKDLERERDDAIRSLRVMGKLNVIGSTERDKVLEIIARRRAVIQASEPTVAIMRVRVMDLDDLRNELQEEWRYAER